MPKGGRRAGAGRPVGTGWRPAVAEMRVAAAERLTTVVGGPKDPLEIVLAIAADETQDTQTRLGACSIALPFLYPKLSATQVEARHTTVNVDANHLLDKLNDRLERLSKPELTQPVLIEATPEPNDEGVGGDA